MYQGVGKIITVLLGLLTTILLTRYLGVLGFGQFNLIIAYLTFAATLADFGLGTVLTREVAKGKARQEIVSNLFTLRLILGLGFLGLFVLLSFFLPYPEIVKTGIVIYALGNLMLLAYNMCLAFFQGELRMEKQMITQIIGSALTLALTAFFINRNFSFEWFVIAQVIGNIAMFIAGYSLLGSNIFFGVRKSIVWNIIKEAWPFSLSAIVTVMYFRIDIILLSFFKDPQLKPDVGIYATAYKIFEVLFVFGTFFSNSLFPLFVKMLKTKEFKEIFRQSLFISFLIACIVIVVVMLFAEFVIRVVAGDAFIVASLPLRILAFSFGISLFTNLYYNLIVALGRQKKIILVGIIAFAFNIVANIIFIPQFSYIASAIITVATTLIILIGYLLII